MIKIGFKLVLIIAIILIIFLAGCSENNSNNNLGSVDAGTYCDSLMAIGNNGCPPDIPVCINNETCVEST